MELKKYSSNFGKALFLGWVRSLACCAVAFIICVIWAIAAGSLENPGQAFLIIMLIMWPFDIIWRWRSFVLMGSELKIKRLLRPTVTVDIRDYETVPHYVGHGLYGATIYVTSKFRLIGKDDSITDVHTSFMTEKTLDQMNLDIENNREFYEGNCV